MTVKLQRVSRCSTVWLPDDDGDDDDNDNDDDSHDHDDAMTFFYLKTLPDFRKGFRQTFT